MDTAEGTGVVRYLIIYSAGPVLTEDIHDMIDRYYEDPDGTLQAVYALTPDGEAAPVDIEDVNNDAGFEFEISRVDGDLIEYICYTDGERTEYEERWLAEGVVGFPELETAPA